MIPLTHFLNWWIWVKVSLWGSCLLWADLCHLKFICWSPHPLVPQNVTVFWRQGLWRGNSGEIRSCGWALMKYDLCPDKRRRLGHKQEKWKLLSRVWLFVTPWNSPGHSTGVGSHPLLQGIFPSQGLNPGLPNCRRILYQLSHLGSPDRNRGGTPREDTRQKTAIYTSQGKRPQKKPPCWHLDPRLLTCRTVRKWISIVGFHSTKWMDFVMAALTV